MPLDDDLHETMARFRAAADAKPVALPEITPPGKVLVAFDMSNQDDAVAAIGTEVCRRFGATPVLKLASPGLDEGTRRKHLETMQTRLPGPCEIAPASDDADPAERILEAIRTTGAKFVVMPAPYLENIGALGRDSVGSTAERVLAHVHVPVLFVREPAASSPAAIAKPLIKLHVRQQEAADALAWAFALAGKSGDYRVMFVVDATAMAEAMALLGHEFDASKLTDQVLLDDAQAAAGSLVAAAQHWASASGARLVVDFKIGSDPDVTARAGNDEGRMLVIPCPSDRNTSGYSRALTVLRLSRVPVLMI